PNGQRQSGTGYTLQQRTCRHQQDSCARRLDVHGTPRSTWLSWSFISSAHPPRFLADSPTDVCGHLRLIMLHGPSLISESASWKVGFGRCLGSVRQIVLAGDKLTSASLQRAACMAFPTPRPPGAHAFPLQVSLPFISTSLINNKLSW
ncbi:hypothetical protein BaRGS_00007371, partial [Batillaria attramentaria]